MSRGRLKTLRPNVRMRTDTRVRVLNSGSWRDGKKGSTARGYGYRWQQASKRFLAEHPLCQCPDCDEGRKRVTAAGVVDHHIAHRGDMTLFWDVDNWRAMAKACHDRKTQRELREEANGKT
jgi:5-methylcytosine-specific restriction enzyme A